MSAWRTWQMNAKLGNYELAEEAKRDYESECRREAKMDDEIERHGYIDGEEDFEPDCEDEDFCE